MDYATRLKKGREAEKIIYKKIQSKFTNVKKSKDRYDPIDFYDTENNICFELKSRNNTKNKYRTTAIGYNKLKHFLEQTKYTDFYFIFDFLDGVYYCVYNRENPDLVYTVENFNNKKALYMMIDVDQLKKIKTLLE